MDHASRHRSATHAKRPLSSKRKVAGQRPIAAKEIENAVEQPAGGVLESAEPGKQLDSRQIAGEGLEICSLTDEMHVSASELH